MRRERAYMRLRYLCVGLTLVALLWGSGAPVAAALPPVTFNPYVDLAATSYGTGVAVGDFNGDGKLDFVVGNGSSGQGNASVLLNTTTTGATTATFAAHADFATPVNVAGVAVGDFNGDGKLDFAVTNRNGGVSVLLNTTTTGALAPTFAAYVTFAAGSDSYAVAVGDVNGDGRPDLVVANGSSNNISVLMNTTTSGAGTPTFAASVNYAVNAGAGGPYGVKLGDINGDGKLDIVATGYTNNNVSVLLGSGSGTFAAHVDFAVGSGPFGIVVGDVNGDGKPDIAVANYGGGNVSVLLNTTTTNAATPTFAAHVEFAAPNAIAVTIADMNGDGVPDLVVADAASTNKVSVLLNTTATNATTPTFATRASFGVHLNPVDVAVADFNGDGKPDVVSANADSDGKASVLLNTSGLTLTSGAGNGGSAAVGTAFTAPVAHVVDSSGAAVSGVSVLFTAPTSGSRGTFAGSANTATAITDGSGNATAPTFTAGTVAGSFTLTATSVGTGNFNGTTTFTLSVTAGVAASVAIVAGNNQTPTVNTAAPTALQAKVTDSNGNTRAGDTVTFTVNLTAGAGATFPGPVTFATAVTNSNGVATAPTLTANTVTGNYTVTASVTGATSASFDLTNVAGSATSLVLSGLTNGAAGTAQVLTVKAVDTYGNTATGYTDPVAFTSTDAQAVLPVSSNLTSGTGSFSVTLKTAGAQTVTATGSGGIVLGQITVTVTAGSAANVTAVSGSGHGTALNSPFLEGNLQAKVTDSYGNVRTGDTVTFTLNPVSGASAAFPGPVTTATAVTNSKGVATAPMLTANGTAGSYTATASMAGVGETASFALTNGIVNPTPTPHTAASPTGTPNAKPSTHTTATPAGTLPSSQPTRH